MLNMMTRGFLPYRAPNSGGPEIMQFSPYGDSMMGINTSFGVPSMPEPMPMQPPMPMPTPMGQSMFDQFNPGQPMFGQPFSDMNFMGGRRPMSGGATRPFAPPTLNTMARRAPRSAGLGFGAGYGGGGRAFGGSTYGTDAGGFNPYNQAF